MWHLILNYVPRWLIFLQAFLLTLVPLLIFLVIRKIKELDSKASGRKQKLEYFKTHPDKAQPVSVSTEQDESSHGFTLDYKTNIELFRNAAADMSDVHERKIFMKNLNIEVVLFFVDGLTDKTELEEHTIKLLLEWGNSMQDLDLPPKGKEFGDMLVEEVLIVSEAQYTQDVKVTLRKVLFGSVLLLINGVPGAILLGGPKGNTRSVEEPISESVLRGPRIGFTETLSENTAMLRRQGESGELAMLSYRIGTRVEKELKVIYFRDIADPELVEEVKRRVSTIDVDEALESGYVEHLIEDNFLSPFPQVQSTERPDRVMAALLEGRVAILLDGSSFALIMPVTYSMMIQSPEDYYERWLASSLIRSLRFMAALISLFAPAIYISFISFHPGLIPTKLLVSIISTRQGVPFPTLIEALILEVSIEILREAGLRLPKPIGPAMGIVGGLIIGQAAVNAGIVSPILVIIVSVTAISSFAAPMYSAGIALRLLRFPIMFTAAVFGLYGVVMFFLLLCIHVLKLQSFGISYLELTAPRSFRSWKDYFIRVPLQFMKTRPALLKSINSKRRN
ncbi:spore germination protein [Paenibacillus sp. P96]|uniref:Spore germination protein n=1 Tax=Paenibacillus zeirhizosphaerae TaxID=2987519 RepID=A0ABT9FLL4_9BACL|nr:spore germination protein [Paenibacillus sp. P96]MDP4095631.1 spore germination protein [Paenibacillus sp. P96]